MMFINAVISAMDILPSPVKSAASGLSPLFSLLNKMFFKAVTSSPEMAPSPVTSPRVVSSIVLNSFQYSAASYAFLQPLGHRVWRWFDWKRYIHLSAREFQYQLPQKSIHCIRKKPTDRCSPHFWGLRCFQDLWNQRNIPLCRQWTKGFQLF